MIAELAVGGIAYWKRDNIESTLVIAWDEASNDTRSEVQGIFECCGWLNLNEGVKPCNYTITCSSAIVDGVKSSLLGVAIVGIIVAIIQILAFVLAGCFFCCCIRNKYNYEQEEQEELLSIKKNPKYEKMESKRQEVADTHAYYRQKYANVT
eukprot:TRINITY_DN672_c0_g1_i1.p1 TRINITY_DN672_c0_g1~~TRINITY_DN672_c0_g1_i1.p1  ORF type:complete len:152 (-),score=16.02 TRINITY_DN672_c0_g1_i1:201-656(-)